MHLGNSIICPVTGIPMILLTGATLFYSLKQARKNFRKDNVFPTVVLTAFVFAMQMINFSIPSVGSSGHIIGAILLSALLGPYVAFISMAVILLIQALFFADGGLLSYGCNLFNMGFLACFVVYPFIYKPLLKMNKLVLACLFACVVALQLGAVSVVIESVLSGTIIGNIGNFTSLMQVVHLPIGFIEGFFTFGIIYFANKTSLSKSFNTCIIVVSFFLAGIISNYASTKPDGLEWSLLSISDFVSYQTQSILYVVSSSIQNSMSILNTFSPVFAKIAGTTIILLLMFLLSKIMLYRNSEINNID